MGTYAKERALDRIMSLAGDGHDLVTLWSEATEILNPVLPNFQGPCWFTLDPASLLITSHFNPMLREELPREMREVESSTPGVEHWVSDLPGGNWDARRLPEAVKSVAAQALRTAEGRDAPGEVALARVLSHSGTWVVLHGATMVSEGPQRVAVIVEPAHPARIVPLLMAAYGLTEREQEVTRLVLQGDSTAQIAEQLVVSPHTVQEHLKHIFEKTGVSSRRDLTGKVFFSHYEPRLRDNERRTAQGKPLRGGPVG